MILRISLENFYSIADEITIDFAAAGFRGKSEVKAENLLHHGGEDYLNIVGVFGANASGKSNIFKAIAFCRNLILTSQSNTATTVLDYQPFKFWYSRPSTFTMDFVCEGMRYLYSFSLMQNRIIAESLYHYPKGRKARIFERDSEGKYIHKKGAIPLPSAVETGTGPATLFLSRASSMNRELAEKIYRMFKCDIATELSSYDLNEIDYDYMERIRPTLLRALEVCDSDIIDIRKTSDQEGRSKLITYHRENPQIPFDFDKEESAGTKRLVEIILAFLSHSCKDCTMLFDEFDLKLHPRLAEFILDIVRDSHSMQLLFSSHNHELLSLEHMRRDQFVFVNKLQNGRSDVYSLYDYTDFKPGMDLQKAYRNGMFDAVPYLGSSRSIIAAEPTE